MKALITIVGAHISGQFISENDKPRNLLNLEFENENQLISKLKELQKGYHIEGVEGTGQPKIKKLSVPSKKYPGKMRTIIDCYSRCDWHHVAHINVSAPSVPTITLK